MDDFELFDLGSFALEQGMVLPNARLAYKLYGSPNAKKSNSILICSYAAGTHKGNEHLIGPGRCFDPDRYFIVSVNLFGSGLSSSPSNTAPPFNGPFFPRVTIRDNVRAQHRLLHDALGIKGLAMVAGYSMGAQQAFQWAVSHPEMVQKIAAWCGHAHTTPHTKAFLGGMSAVVKLDAAWKGGEYSERPVKGLRAAARVYAGWGFSQEWYAQELFRDLGYVSLDDFVVRFLEDRFLRRDPNDYLCHVDTWYTHNVGDTDGFGGSYHKALQSIRCPALVMPGRTDLYFPAADAAEECEHIERAIQKPIPSVWGHFAGMGINQPDTDFIETAIKDFLSVDTSAITQKRQNRRSH
jgi:homoserine O-acetyltransferase/O-succinyltransferase